MDFKLYELLSGIYKELKYKKGYIFVIKVIPFKEKTGFLLSSKGKNISERKRRPIIIASSNKEKIKFFALSKNKNFLYIRPKFNLKECKINNSASECFGLDLKKSSINLIFAKKNKNKKFRVYYEINIHIFDELQEEGNLNYCGKCSEEIINEARLVIEEYFEGKI